MNRVFFFFFRRKLQFIFMWFSFFFLCDIGRFFFFVLFHRSVGYFISIEHGHRQTPAGGWGGVGACPLSYEKNPSQTSQIQPKLPNLATPKIKTSLAATATTNHQAIKLPWPPRKKNPSSTTEHWVVCFIDRTYG